MAETAIEFWFDFSSPYAYFAARGIEALAVRHARRVLWRPFMLGVAFKHTGMGSLSRTPLRGDYARHDWARLARRDGIAFRLPPGHPITALPASRIFYWLDETRPHLAPAFAKAVFHAYFIDNRDLASVEGAAALVAALGLDPALAAAAARNPEVKERFKRRTEEAIAKGVFGSPFILIDGEPFWGSDRLGMVDEWLTRGGW